MNTCPYCDSTNTKIIKELISKLNNKKYFENSCKNCNLHFFTPLQYENVYETEINPNYREFHEGRNYIPVWSLGAAKALKKINANLKDKKIFDVGSGDCINFVLLANQFNTLPENYYGLDLDSKSINVCKKRGLSNLYNQYFDAKITETIKQKFDMILATEVLEHQLNPKEFFNTTFSMLNPGGLLVITVPYRKIAPIPWKHREISPPPHHFLLFDKKFFRKNFPKNLEYLKTFPLHQKGEIIPKSKFASKEIFGTESMYPLLIPPVLLVRAIDSIVGHGLIAIIRKSPEL